MYAVLNKNSILGQTYMNNSAYSQVPFEDSIKEKDHEIFSDKTNTQTFPKFLKR